MELVQKHDDASCTVVGCCCSGLPDGASAVAVLPVMRSDASCTAADHGLDMAVEP